ncbi:EamA family transporter [Proteiniphilum sp.]|uniref:EamA family transporter n=1 Tax=Proteiniphilum sp. TaxID=1926877 RepID=UPI002B1EF968|nr:EamA family transporter [Proteiniphilum sp.]MEA4916442.1 EamA family transporter [Proteiniphilum sp.]
MAGTFLVAMAVVLRVIFNPLANVYQKQLGLKGNNPLIVNFFSYLLLAAFSTILLIFVDTSNSGRDFWLYSTLGGIAGAMGNGFLVRALQMGDLSVLGPINSYKSVIGIIVGIFLLSEIPNVWGIAGIALIIYGSYYVLDTTDEKFSWKLLRTPAIQYRIWAMVLTAIEAVFIKRVILVSSTTLAFVSWCIFGAFFSFIILFFYKIRLKTELRRTVKLEYLSKFLLLVACIGIMQFTTNYVFDHMPVGYALSLFQLSIIVSVLFGYKFFQEKDIGKKIIGSVIMIVGSVMIILLKN